jgi:hypothetical protein
MNHLWEALKHQMPKHNNSSLSKSAALRGQHSLTNMTYTTNDTKGFIMIYKHHLFSALISSISLSTLVYASDNVLSSRDQDQSRRLATSVAETDFFHTRALISQPEFNFPNIIDALGRLGHVRYLRVESIPATSTEKYTNNAHSQLDTHSYGFRDQSVHQQDSTAVKGKKRGGLSIGGISIGGYSGGGSTTNHSRSALDVHEQSEEHHNAFDNNPYCSRKITQAGIKIEVEYQDRSSRLRRRDWLPQSSVPSSPSRFTLPPIGSENMPSIPTPRPRPEQNDAQAKIEQKLRGF